MDWCWCPVPGRSPTACNAQRRGGTRRRLGADLGDEGSGYWIGRRALAAVMRAADGRGPRTAAHAAGARPHFTWARPRRRAGGEVYERAERRRRHRHAGAGGRAGAATRATPSRRRSSTAPRHELALAAASVATRLDMRGELFRTVLSGGMFRSIPSLASEVTKRLAEVAPRTTVAPLSVEPATGAVRLALAEAGGGARVPVYLRRRWQRIVITRTFDTAAALAGALAERVRVRSRLVRRSCSGCRPATRRCRSTPHSGPKHASAGRLVRRYGPSTSTSSWA